MIDVKPLKESVLVFLHIKKTAGISLQRILSKQFGARFYGGHSHSLLKGRVASNELTVDAVSQVPNGSCICKHWKMSEFEGISHRCNFVTVLREPLNRIVSHYNFYRMHHNDGLSIDEYIRQPGNINLQSQTVDADGLCEAYVFERLAEDLKKSKLIRSSGVDHINKTRYKYTFTDSQIRDFYDLNKADVELYQSVEQGR